MGLGKRLVRLALLATLLGGTATVLAPEACAAGQPAAAADQGFVRCANLSPGTPEDIYLYPFGDPKHPTVLMHDGYGSVSEYMPVKAGQYTVAMRPAGAAASSPPSVSTSFMVSAGANYTVASIGPASARRLQVLTDQMSGQAGSQVLVRVIQASVKQPRVTVAVGADTLARQLAFGQATSYQAVKAGTPVVRFTAAGGRAAKAVRLAAGSVHTIVVLDAASGSKLKIGNLTDAAGSPNAPKGGAATGMGGTAPGPGGPGPVPWLATLGGGVLLAAAGAFGLRRSRRASTAEREYAREGGRPTALQDAALPITRPWRGVADANRTRSLRDHGPALCPVELRPPCSAKESNLCRLAGVNRALSH
jgi:hypothetical protein